MAFNYDDYRVVKSGGQRFLLPKPVKVTPVARMLVSNLHRYSVNSKCADYPPHLKTTLLNLNRSTRRSVASSIPFAMFQEKRDTLMTPLYLVCTTHSKNLDAKINFLVNRCNVEIDSMLFTKNNSKHSLLYEACQKGKLEVVNLLIKYGANINIVQGEWDYCLNAAILHGHDEVVSTILYSGAKVLIRDSNMRGPVFYARRNLEMLTNLVLFGADINDLPGTVLHHNMDQSIYFFKQVLVLGANLQKVNDRGENILMFAACKGNLEKVRFLIQLGVYTREECLRGLEIACNSMVLQKKDTGEFILIEKNARAYNIFCMVYFVSLHFCKC